MAKQFKFLRISETVMIEFEFIITSNVYLAMLEKFVTLKKLCRHLEAFFTYA